MYAVHVCALYFDMALQYVPLAFVRIFRSSREDPGPEQDAIEKQHRSLVEAAAILSLSAVKHDVRAARRQDDGDTSKPGDRRHSYLPYSDSHSNQSAPRLLPTGFLMQ